MLTYEELATKALAAQISRDKAENMLCRQLRQLRAVCQHPCVIETIFALDNYLTDRTDFKYARSCVSCGLDSANMGDHDNREALKTGASLGGNSQRVIKVKNDEFYILRGILVPIMTSDEELPANLAALRKS